MKKSEDYINETIISNVEQSIRFAEREGIITHKEEFPFGVTLYHWVKREDLDDYFEAIDREFKQMEAKRKSKRILRWF